MCVVLFSFLYFVGFVCSSTFWRWKGFSRSFLHMFSVSRVKLVSGYRTVPKSCLTGWIRLGYGGGRREVRTACIVQTTIVQFPRCIGLTVDCFVPFVRSGSADVVFLGGFRGNSQAPDCIQLDPKLSLERLMQVHLLSGPINSARNFTVQQQYDSFRVLLPVSRVISWIFWCWPSAFLKRVTTTFYQIRLKCVGTQVSDCGIPPPLPALVFSSDGGGGVRDLIPTE